MPSRLHSMLAPLLSVIALLANAPVLAEGQAPYWTKAAPPSLARQELYPEVLDGKIYVAGGLLSPNTGYSKPMTLAKMHGRD